MKKEPAAKTGSMGEKTGQLTISTGPLVCAET